MLRVRLPLPEDLEPGQLLIGNGQAPTSAIALEEGRAGDLIGTYWGNLYLITERFRTVLTDNGILGWRTQRLDIVGPRGTLLTAWLLIVTGRCGPIYGAGGEGHPDVPGIGQYLDPSRWDGSDMFVPDNVNAIHITAECADVLSRAKLSNLRIEPAGLEELPECGR